MWDKNNKYKNKYFIILNIIITYENNNMKKNKKIKDKSHEIINKIMNIKFL